jgi:hypothetical protein
MMTLSSFFAMTSPNPAFDDRDSCGATPTMLDVRADGASPPERVPV